MNGRRSRRRDEVSILISLAAALGLLLGAIATAWVLTIVSERTADISVKTSGSP